MIHGHMAYDVSVSSYDEGSFKEKRNYMRMHILTVLFTWLISRTFSANEQYFSLTTNQSTVLSAMAYQPSEQDTHGARTLLSRTNNGAHNSLARALTNLSR